MKPQNLSRRALLGTAGAVAIGMSGCVGSGSNDTNPDVRTAVASFFTFYDFARQIAEGTPFTVKNLVPTGLHGHGWEPDPSITRDIVDADVFLHVGPDFQPWADRAIATLRDDGVDTHLVNVREGIPLIDLADTVEDDEQVGEGKDPHFWLDPALAQQAIDNIVSGFSDIEPDYEEQMLENAEHLKDDLDEIDAEWEDIFEQAEREIVFLAAHNAFEYVSQRYGVTIHPLVMNLAANDDVRPADMRRAEDTINENNIQHIGAAVFEPRRPAQQLVSETAVEAYYPVTPYAGITSVWEDQGWGYTDIARHINMPTFSIVTGAAEPMTEFENEWRNFE